MKIKLLILLVFFLLVAYLVMPFISALFAGFLIAYLIYPVNTMLKKRFKNTRIVSFFSTIIAVIFFSFLFYLFNRMIVISLIQIQHFFDSDALLFNTFLSNHNLRYFIRTSPSNFVNFTESLFVNAPKILMDLFLITFIVYYSLSESHKLKKWFIENFLTKNNEQLFNAFTKRANYVLKNFLLQYFFSGALIALVIFISLSFLKVNYALELSTLAFVISVFPIVSGWILTSILSVYYYLLSNYFTAVILLLVSFLLFFINNYFYKIFSDKKGIDPLILIIGIVSGVLSLGLFGFVAGPIFGALIQSAYEVISEKY